MQEILLWNPYISRFSLFFWAQASRFNAEGFECFGGFEVRCADCLAVVLVIFSGELNLYVGRL